MTVPQPSPGETLAEALAWWSIGVGRDRRALSDAAAQALVDGLDSAALRELAGIGVHDNPFEVDDLIARTVGELILENSMTRLTAPKTADGIRSLRRHLDDWEPGGRLFSFPSRIF